MAILKEKVLSVHHWTDKTFSFKTTRNMGFRFKNGEFAMIGLEVENRPLLRAYSIASPNHEDHLEFLSIFGSVLCTTTKHRKQCFEQIGVKFV